MTPKYEIEELEPRKPQPGVNHGAVARGFGQTFGILPSIAFLTLIVDAMLFGAEAGTLGASLPISCAAGAVLAVITILAQRKYYGDDYEGSLIKGLILGFLTAMGVLLAFVGGLGLAGTMGVNVLERTRELGVLRAIGAPMLPQ